MSAEVENVKVYFTSPIKENTVTWQDLITNLGGRLESILKSNPKSIVPMPVKDKRGSVVGWRYEITREIALSVLNFIENVMVALGGNVKYSKEIIKDEGEFYVKATITLDIPNTQSPTGFSTIRKEAFGGCTLREMVDDKKARIRMEHDALGTAETRAIKRLIEEVIGEDKINKLIKEIKEGYGTERKTLDEIEPKVILNSLKVFNEIREKNDKEPVEIEKILNYLTEQGKLKEVKKLSEYSKPDLLLINSVILSWTEQISK